MKFEEERLQLAKELSLVLVNTSAIQFCKFTLSSGKMSSYYIDLRIVPSHPNAFDLAVNAYIRIIKNMVGLSNFDAICGVPTSGLTFASAVAYDIGKPLIYVRDKKKGYGTSKKIEGLLESGWRILVLDDLITTGTALVKTIDTIRKEGGEVNDVIVLIDRLEGGGDNLSDKKVRLNSVTNIKEITKTLHEMDIITSNQKKNIEDQVRKKK